MHRYGDMDFYMNMDYDDGIEIIKESLEQQRKQEYWDIYIAKYPNMTQKDFVPFEDFYKRRDVSKMETDKAVYDSPEDKKEYVLNTISMAEKIKRAHQEQKNNKDLHVEKPTMK